MRNNRLLLCFLLLLSLSSATTTALRRPQPIIARRKINKNNQKTVSDHPGTASVGASIFNLVNNVAGAGILALSAGQAKGTGWIPSIAICALLGVISARTFSMIGEACELTGEEDFKVRIRGGCRIKSQYL